MDTDDRGQCLVRWKKEGKECIWGCIKQLQSPIMPEDMDKCFLTNCRGRSRWSPSPRQVEERLKEIEEEKRRKEEEEKRAEAEKNLCEWCKVKEIADGRKKYCSDTCRKRYSRSRHRDKIKKIILPPRPPHIPAPLPTAPDNKCSHVPCDKEKAEGRKYCSDRCRLAASRRAYRMRAKAFRRSVNAK